MSDKDVEVKDIDNVVSGTDDYEDKKFIIGSDQIKHSTYTVIDIYEMCLRKSSMLLTPTFQREYCWKFKKSCYFLDSLFYCPVIPSFMIYKLPETEAEELRIKESNKNLTHECIDGRHRLEIIRTFIRGEFNEEIGDYLYITSTDEKKTKLFYNLTPAIIKKFKKKPVRQFDEIEKYRFDKIELQFQTITKKLSEEDKCSLFARLQNGEKVSALMKFKNYLHPVTNYLRKNRCFSIEFTHEWNNVLSSTSKEYSIGKMICIITRLIFMTDKGNLDVNFSDANLIKYIGNDAPATRLAEGHTVEYLLGIIYERKQIIEKILEKTKTTVIEEFYYILHDIDPKHFKKALIRFFKLNKLDNYNKSTKYSKTTVTKDIMNRKRSEFVEELEKIKLDL